MALAIKAENISKLYQLGEFSTGAISKDIERWFYKIRGKEDPFLTVSEVNDRTTKGDSNMVWSLRDINFKVQQGDAIGIIGRNGAGKSTLLKILSRITTPTTGKVLIKGRIASLLEVGTGFHPELTGRENVFLNGAILGMRKGEIRKKFDEIVDFAGIERYIDTPVKRYSSGMYVRLAFAVAAFLEPEILIVDEVLAVGDTEFQKKCLGRMKDVSINDGRTVLFVSHQMNAIQSLCNKCLYLKNGMLMSEGPTKLIVEHYARDNRHVKNSKSFDKYLNYIKIEQKDSVLIVEAEYDCEFGLDIPHLGFVIHNSGGVPVFASNPTLDLQDISIQRKYKKGKIAVTINQPKLIDGEYVASIWFGDSKENFIADLECISFEVLGMTNKKQYTQTLTGNIIPELSWRFYEYD